MFRDLRRPPTLHRTLADFHACHTWTTVLTSDVTIRTRAEAYPRPRASRAVIKLSMYTMFRTSSPKDAETAASLLDINSP